MGIGLPELVIIAATVLAIAGVAIFIRRLARGNK
jgi:hypothetical protein